MKLFRPLGSALGLIVAIVLGSGLYLVPMAIAQGRTGAQASAGNVTIEDQDSSIQYDDWRGVVDLSASGGSYRVSNVAGNASGISSFSFSGTAVTWVSLKGPDQGKAQVSIDGASQGIFDMYSSTVQYNFQQTFSGLANARHTLTVKVGGAKNTSSSDFNVVVDAFVVGSTTTQDNDVGVQFNNWQGGSNANASGGTFRQDGASGADARLTFSGTSISWVSALGPKYGQANVLIDGGSQGTVDLFAVTQQWQAAFTYAGLSAGQHTIEIKPLGTKNPASGGTSVVVDAFSLTTSPTSTPTSTGVVTSTPSPTPTTPATSTSTDTPANTPTPTVVVTNTPTPSAQATNTPTDTPTISATSTATPTVPPTVTTVGEEDAPVQYDCWRGVVDPNANGGTYRVCNVPGTGTTTSTASTVFTGTAITWISLNGPNQGEANVYLDNVLQGTFDLYAPTVAYNVQRTFGGLANSSHVLRITVNNAKNPNSTDYNVAVDGFLIGGSTIQDNSTGIKYGRWEGQSSAQASAGTYREAATSNGDARLTFIGTSISWIGALGPKYGQANVLIDGVSQGTFDLYAPAQHWQVAFPFSGLSNGQHTIEIKPLETKNPLSQNTYVAVDSFTGPITPVSP